MNTELVVEYCGWPVDCQFCANVIRAGENAYTISYDSTIGSTRVVRTVCGNCLRTLRRLMRLTPKRAAERAA